MEGLQNVGVLILSLSSQFKCRTLGLVQGFVSYSSLAFKCFTPAMGLGQPSVPGQPPVFGPSGEVGGIPIGVFVVLVALMISGKLQCRVNRLGTAVRLVYQTGGTTPSAFLDYLWSILGPYCKSGWKHMTTTDPRDGTVSTRSVLTTRFLPCFMGLYLLFYPNGGSHRVITQEALSYLNELGLAVLIMAGGYQLDYGSRGRYYNAKLQVDWWLSGLVIRLAAFLESEMRLLFVAHLEGFGLSPVFALSRARIARAHRVVMVPFSHILELQKLVLPHLLPEYRHLVFTPDTYLGYGNDQEDPDDG